MYFCERTGGVPEIRRVGKCYGGWGSIDWPLKLLKILTGMGVAGLRSEK